MPDGLTGFRTALDMARDINGAETPQPDLFRAPAENESASAVEVTRGRGRPKGAHNLSTKRFAQWLLAHHGSPLMASMRVATLDITDEETLRELARRWGCTRLEALDRWIRINDGIKPYVHQQMPRAVIFSPGDPNGLDDDDDALPLPRLKALPGDDARDVTPRDAVIDHE